MSAGGDEGRAGLRHAIYAILIVTSLAAVAGRIAAITSVDVDGVKRRPFLSANDRSRWCTVRALVERGTYAIDEIVQEPGWDTIDMVKHDGHLYSSKPPLLATLVAGEYWLLQRWTGRTLGEAPHALGRIMLWSINLPALAVYFVVLAALIDRYGATDWGRLFAMTVATWGTFLTTFGVALNNHLLAAAAAVVAVAVVWKAWRGELVNLGLAAAGGLAAGFMVANELPSLALAVLLVGGIAWRSPTPVWGTFLAAFLLVNAASLGTNYLAHGTFSPPYATQTRDPAGGENWYVYTYERNGRTVESYWQNLQGIDAGEPSRAVYAFHTLVGHHGILSLTPVWLLSIVGLLTAIASRRSELRAFAAAVFVVTVVCLVFYWTRPLIQRNYGGQAAGLRWMFWFAPVWIVGMLPAVDWCAARRWARAGCLTLLAAGVFSAAYATWNPWVHPWLYDFLAWVSR